jgi:ppGpp synthetase/RelA/SpoT-type nucleotidyltranferase
MTEKAESKSIDQAEFLVRHNLSLEKFEKSELEWSVLERILARHRQMISELATTGSYVSGLLQRVPQVHSLKVRIKDPERLVAKLIRKGLENPEFAVDCDTYEEHVPDLIGIRALHLFKDEWQPIHEFVVTTWDLHEQPIAYVRDGDPEEICNAFKEAKCKVVKHEFGYRSVHYVIKTQPGKRVRLAELQVRTVFEEGWSEIDHSVRYPQLSSDPNLTFSLAILNRFAGSADEMGTFVKALNTFLVEEKIKLEERDREIAKKEKKLKTTISKLKIRSAEKEALKQQLESLRKSSYLGVGPSVLSGSITLESLGPTGPVLNYARGAAGDIFCLEKICKVCGKKYRDSGMSVMINDRCPDCRDKFLATS